MMVLVIKIKIDWKYFANIFICVVIEPIFIANAYRNASVSCIDYCFVFRFALVLRSVLSKNATG